MFYHIKAAIWLIATSLLCLFYMGCNKPAERPAGNVIQHPLGAFVPYQAQVRSFKMNLPVQWTVKEYALPPVVKAAAASTINNNAEPMYAENLLFEALPLSTVYNLPTTKTDSVPPFDLRTLSRWFFEDLQLKSSHYKVVEIGETLVNGVNTAQFVYTYKNPQEYTDELKAITFLLIHKNEAWLFTCTDDSNVFNKKKKKFEYMLQSIRVVYR